MCLEVSERKTVKAEGKSGRVSHFPFCKVERECRPMRGSAVAATFWAERQVRKGEEQEGLTCVLHRVDIKLVGLYNTSFIMLKLN